MSKPSASPERTRRFSRESIAAALDEIRWTSESLLKSLAEDKETEAIRPTRTASAAFQMASYISKELLDSGIDKEPTFSVKSSLTSPNDSEAVLKFIDENILQVDGRQEKTSFSPVPKMRDKLILRSHSRSISSGSVSSIIRTRPRRGSFIHPPKENMYFPTRLETSSPRMGIPEEKVKILSPKKSPMLNALLNLTFYKGNGILEEPKTTIASWADIICTSAETEVGKMNIHLKSLKELCSIDGFSEKSLMNCVLRYMENLECRCSSRKIDNGSKSCSMAMLKLLRVNGLVAKLFECLYDPKLQHIAFASLMRLDETKLWHCASFQGNFAHRDFCTEFDQFIAAGELVVTKETMEIVIVLMLQLPLDIDKIAVQTSSMVLEESEILKQLLSQEIRDINMLYIFLSIFKTPGASESLQSYSKAILSLVALGPENAILLFRDLAETGHRIMSLILFLLLKKDESTSNDINTVCRHFTSVLSCLVFHSVITEPNPEECASALENIIIKFLSFEGIVDLSDLGARFLVGILSKMTKFDPLMLSSLSDPFFKNSIVILDSVWQYVAFSSPEGPPLRIVNGVSPDFVVVKAVMGAIAVHLHKNTYDQVADRQYGRTEALEKKKKPENYHKRLQRRMAYFFDLGDLIGAFQDTEEISSERLNELVLNVVNYSEIIVSSGSSFSGRLKFRISRTNGKRTKAKQERLLELYERTRKAFYRNTKKE